MEQIKGCSDPKIRKAELDRVLRSPTLQRAKKLIEILRFCFDETEANGRPKQVEIEEHLDKKGFHHDQVRVDINRLRTKMRQYYERDGCKNSIRLEIPLERPDDAHYSVKCYDNPQDIGIPSVTLGEFGR